MWSHPAHVDLLSLTLESPFAAEGKGCLEGGQEARGEEPGCPHGCPQHGPKWAIPCLGPDPFPITQNPEELAHVRADPPREASAMNPAQEQDIMQSTKASVHRGRPRSPAGLLPFTDQPLMSLSESHCDRGHLVTSLSTGGGPRSETSLLTSLEQVIAVFLCLSFLIRNRITLVSSSGVVGRVSELNITHNDPRDPQWPTWPTITHVTHNNSNGEGLEPSLASHKHSVNISFWY